MLLHVQIVGNYTVKNVLNEANINFLSCPLGYYCTGDGNSISCQAGYYTKDKGTIKCDYCNFRCYYVSQQSRCDPCPIGNICTSTQLQPKPCPKDTFTKTTGSNTLNDCKKEHCPEYSVCDEGIAVQKTNEEINAIKEAELNQLHYHFLD